MLLIKPCETDTFSFSSKTTLYRMIGIDLTACTCAIWRRTVFLHMSLASQCHHDIISFCLFSYCICFWYNREAHSKDWGDMIRKQRGRDGYFHRLWQQCSACSLHNLTKCLCHFVCLVLQWYLTAFGVPYYAMVSLQLNVFSFQSMPHHTH